MNTFRLIRLVASIAITLAGLFILFLLLNGSHSIVQAMELGDSPALPHLGSTRYVATTGVDTGDCTNNTAPCRTVQYAVDVASEGDAIKGVQTAKDGKDLKNG